MVDRSGWSVVLDPESGADARAAAWRALRERARPAVLFQLRRRVRGWRLTEELADEVFERVRARCAGGGHGAPQRLREAAAGAVLDLLRERDDAAASPSLDDAEFERDWASSLCGAALRELGRTAPESHRLLLRLYDRPEGAPPLDVTELAARLGTPPGEAARSVADARAELRRLFEREVGRTVADPALAAAETDALLPLAGDLFRG